MSSSGGGVSQNLGDFFSGGATRRSREIAQTNAETSEQQRQALNDRTFNIATDLAGKIGQFPFLKDPSQGPDLGITSDFSEGLNFAGADPRQARLSQLINIFTRRSEEVRNAQNAPGLSQTRLSLLE